MPTCPHCGEPGKYCTNKNWNKLHIDERGNCGDDRCVREDWICVKGHRFGCFSCEV